MGSSGILAILDGLGLGLVVSLQLGLHLLDAGLGGLGGITSLLGHLGLELLHLSLELLTGSLTLGSVGSSCLGLLHGVGSVGSSIGSGLLVGSSGGIAELLGSLLELGGLSSKGGLIGGELGLLLTSLLGLGISLGLGVGGMLDGGRISLEQEELLGASLWLGTTDSSSSTSGVGNGLAQSWTRIASGEAAIGARLLVHRHVIDHLLEAGIGALVNAVTEGVDHTVVGLGLGARVAVLRALGHSIADSVDGGDHLGVLSRGVLVVTELATVLTGSVDQRHVIVGGHSSLGIGVGINELLALIGRLLRHDSSRGVVGTHPGLTTVLTTVVTRLVGARHVVIAQVRALVGDLLASAILSTALGAIDGTLGVLGILRMGSLVGSSLGIPSSVRLGVSCGNLVVLGLDGSLLGSSILVVLGLLGSDGSLGSLGLGSVIHILLSEVLLHGIVLGIELSRVGLELGTHGSSLGVVVIEDL